MIRLLLPGGSAPGTSRAGPATIVTADEAARLTAQAREALIKGPVRFTSPYDFMFTSTYLSPIGPPWAEIVAYDLNTGDIKWRVPHGARCRAERAGDSGRQRRSLAARRSAGHRGRVALCRLRLRQDAARLRPADGTRGLDARAACRVRWCAGVVRDRRAPVHRRAGRGRTRLESRALSLAPAGTRQRLHRVRAAGYGSVTRPVAAHSAPRPSSRPKVRSRTDSGKCPSAMTKVRPCPYSVVQTIGWWMPGPGIGCCALP